MPRRASSLAVSSRAREATISCRAAAFETAVATRPVKSAIRDSMLGGKGVSRLVDAAITPHVRPPTTMGQPTDDRMPRACASRAIGPDVPTNESTRAGRPVAWTWAAMLAPSRSKRVPTASCASPLRLHAATAVTV